MRCSRPDRPGRRASRSAPLDEAAGRCLAATVTSPRDVPAFDNAAVDGFAFAFADGMREAGARLPLAPGRAAAGHPFTGLPPADRRCACSPAPSCRAGPTPWRCRKSVAVEGDSSPSRAGLKRGANRRVAGEDVRAGEAVLQPGTRLRPQEIGLAAELGCATLPVFEPLQGGHPLDRRRARRAGPRPRRAGSVFDANRHPAGAAAVAAGRGHRPRHRPRRPCRSSPTLRRAAAAPPCRPDLRRRVARRRGPCRAQCRGAGPARFLADRDEARPTAGVRPAGRGRVRRACPAILWPPWSASCCSPGRCCCGWAVRLARAHGLPLPAAFGLTKQAGRSEYLRARLGARSEQARSLAQRIEREGSGILTSMVEAAGSGRARRRAVERVEPGDPVPFLSFAELGIPL